MLITTILPGGGLPAGSSHEGSTVAYRQSRTAGAKAIAPVRRHPNIVIVEGERIAATVEEAPTVGRLQKRQCHSGQISMAHQGLGFAPVRVGGPRTAGK